MKIKIAVAVVLVQLLCLSSNARAGEPVDYLHLSGVNSNAHAGEPVDYLLRDSAVRDENGDILAACISPGGEYSSFRLVYWNYPPTVRPGAKLVHRIAWQRIGANPSAVLYLTVISDWQPDQPLATLINGGFQAVGEEQVGEVEFTAPRKPGTYRVRWIMAAAFSPVTNFYSKEDDQNPIWCEIVFKVEGKDWLGVSP